MQAIAKKEKRNEERRGNLNKKRVIRIKKPKTFLSKEEDNRIRTPAFTMVLCKSPGQDYDICDFAHKITQRIKIKKGPSPLLENHIFYICTYSDNCKHKMFYELYKKRN